MIVFDTDAVSELMRARPSSTLLEHLAKVSVADQATTTVTIGELSYGAHKAGRPDLYARAANLLAGVRILPFDTVTAEHYGELRAVLEKEGCRPADPDLRIAATTLAQQAVLVTGNVRHFARVPGLEVQDWIHGRV